MQVNFGLLLFLKAVPSFCPFERPLLGNLIHISRSLKWQWQNEGCKSLPACDVQLPKACGDVMWQESLLGPSLGTSHLGACKA